MNPICKYSAGSWGLFAVLLCGSGACFSAERPVKPLELAVPLAAYWAMDDPSGPRCEDLSGAGSTAVPSRPESPGYERVPGVFGLALQFQGGHRLTIPAKPDLSSVERITISAWVQPAGFERYNEIFRKEDGDRRVLFSFQEHATVLSLGLNVQGYFEADAPIQPDQVLDGEWHHCAGTFDGRHMRVYLDGREILSMERPGTIRAGGPAPGAIGSMDGAECFQGLMDELRIYREALSASDIARLHENGRQALAETSAALKKALAEIYPEGKPFAETLALCRQLHATRGLPPAHLFAMAARLKRDFPAESARLNDYTGANLLACLKAGSDDFYRSKLEHLVELLLEYKPLTEAQWAQQTPEEIRKWREAEALGKSFEELKISKTPNSPDWVTLILEVGKRVQFRPRIEEAVAPYVRPTTPATRSLRTAEAHDALERDWLHQVGGAVTAERIFLEVAWARDLAARFSGRDAAGEFKKELARLDLLESQIPGAGASLRNLYFQVREVKRRIIFRNPVIDFDQVLFVDMPLPQGSEWQHETRHRLGYMAVPGGRLMSLRGLSPEGEVRQIMPQSPLHGSFWRPDVSYDGKQIVLCFKPHNEKSFHLYTVKLDGSELRQITSGVYDDLDPVWLPDGKILFSTTRAHTYVRCMPPTSAFVLARCDADGSNLFILSQNNEPDYLPSVMGDGRIIYTRWEYTDKPLWRAQKLWTMNPDGTYVSMFWGNQSVWPDVMKDARTIPGSRKVMFTGSAHHNWFAGSIGIIDPDAGLNFPHGITKVTAEAAWPECGNGPVDPVTSARYHTSGKYEAYQNPYPLGEYDFLVSAQRGGKFVLYLMDVEGNRELVYEGTHHIFHAAPLKPRPVRPIIPDRVDWPVGDSEPREGVIFSNNVYQNAPPELAGKARYLRVLHIEPKTYTYWHKRPYISTGPVVSMVQSEGVKRILGTVPIERDGSVAFKAPPGKALHFQLLDEQFRALQTMRSFVGVMPGEHRGCLGCHEQHSRAPVTSTDSLALARPPSPITPPPWEPDTVSYPRYVQPVLDRYCGKCHQGDGEGRKTLDLTLRPGFLMFSEPYVTLVGRPTWGAKYVAPAKPAPGFGIAGMLMVEGYGQVDPEGYRTPPPMTALSYRSKLIEIASSGQHHEVKVDEVSRQRLIAWVDAMCPYYGDEEIRTEQDPVFQGVDWLAVRPRITTAPRIQRP